LKTYRSPRDIIAEVEGWIAADKPSPRPPSMLVRFAQLLCEARHYRCAAIYLLAGEREVPRAICGPGPESAPRDAPEQVVPIKIAGRVLGSLRVQAEHETGLGRVDWVLLKDVAEILARYLTGKGKYLLRKTREAASAQAAANAKVRGYQPSSEKAAPEEVSRRPAAGERSRT